MRKLFACFLVLGLTGCVPDYLEDAQRWYVPLDNIPRAANKMEQVAFLEAEPKDRSFKVIGIVAPADDEYDSYAETVNAARLSAALHGADAIFLISEEEGARWGFRAGEVSAGGGSKTTTKIRAKAIVWTK